MKSRQFIEKILESADVKINGNRPFDIQIKNEKFYDRLLAKGTLGLGESYMDGWWECEQLDEMICRILKSQKSTVISKILTCSGVNTERMASTCLTVRTCKAAMAV